MNLSHLPYRVRYAAGRFPEDLALLSQLVVDDEEFGSLCEDLALAAEVLQQLETAGAQADAARKAEYRTLVAELEREVGGILAKHRQ